ncbi:GNAT family N-acetyltransferase [Streptomyces sp. CA-111067]|uniref:GNAT family N-acetyltransferase n=1 Tax=Streptomyces sp. CA-111067 TaxID=3240046 RepID=UPI003D9835DB
MNHAGPDRAKDRGHTAPVHVEITNPRSADAQYCLRCFFEELDERFDTGFDPSRSVSAGHGEMTLPAGLLLVATAEGSPVGCGAVKFHRDTGVGEVKRMWVAPVARGLGLGRRLLESLADESSSRGMRMLRLETNRALSEARRLYRAAGFTEVEPYNDEPYADYWFQRNLPRT